MKKKEFTGKTKVYKNLQIGDIYVFVFSIIRFRENMKPYCDIFLEGSPNINKRLYQEAKD